MLIIVIDELFNDLNGTSKAEVEVRDQYPGVFRFIQWLLHCIPSIYSLLKKLSSRIMQKYVPT